MALGQRIVRPYSLTYSEGTLRTCGRPPLPSHTCTHTHSDSSKAGMVARLPGSEFPGRGSHACLMVACTVGSSILQFRPVLSQTTVHTSHLGISFLEGAARVSRGWGTGEVPPQHPHVTGSWVLRGQSLRQVPSGEAQGEGTDSAFLMHF